MQITSQKKWGKWTLVVIWCTLIFYATQSPNFTGENTEKLIKQVTNKENIPNENNISHENLHPGFSLNKLVRKSTHLVAYGILALLLLFALSNAKYRYSIAWFLATFYGVTDEFHQSFIPGRTGSVYDVGYDSLGAFLALILYKLYSSRKIRSSSLGHER